MTERFDLVIVGGGVAGAAAARAAGVLGLRAALVERSGPGTPPPPHLVTIALAAAARRAAQARRADRLGIRVTGVDVDGPAVWRWAQGAAASAAALDAQPPLGPGLTVAIGHGRLTGATEVTVNGERVLTARHVLLCVGARPRRPDLAGSPEALDPEQLVALPHPPRSVTLVGAGSTGVTLAQTLARLDVRTTLVEQHDTILPDDEPTLTELLADCLRADGVDLRLGVDPATPDVFDGVVVRSAGYEPDVGGLGLDDLGVEVADDGAIVVDARGRTNVPSIWAAGAVTGRRASAAAADDAVQAVRAMAGARAARAEWVPSSTSTDPELARVGLSSSDAERLHGDSVDVWPLDLARLPSAFLDDTPPGRFVLVTARGRVVGAHLLAPAASELIHELALAARLGVELTDVAALPHVEPSWSAGIGRLATVAALERVSRLRWLPRRR